MIMPNRSRSSFTLQVTDLARPKLLTVLKAKIIWVISTHADGSPPSKYAHAWWYCSTYWAEIFRHACLQSQLHTSESELSHSESWPWAGFESYEKTVPLLMKNQGWTRWWIEVLYLQWQCKGRWGSLFKHHMYHVIMM
jgi:hypothetical protein